MPLLADPKDNELFSKEMQRLVDYVLQKKLIKRVLTEQTHDKDLGIAHYDYNNIALIADRPNSGDPTVAHEIIHAFAESDLKRKNKYNPAIRVSNEQMEREVRSSIQKGSSWSGVTRDGKATPHSLKEGEAYWLTHSKVARPISDRARHFGYFLRDYDVPLDIAAGAVQALKRVAKPEKRWSGGGAELFELKKRRQYD